MTNCWVCHKAGCKKCSKCDVVVCEGCIAKGFVPDKCTMCQPLRKTRNMTKMQLKDTPEYSLLYMAVGTWQDLHPDEKAGALLTITSNAEKLVPYWMSNLSGARKARCIIAHKMNEIVESKYGKEVACLREMAARVHKALAWSHIPKHGGVDYVAL